MNTRWSEPSLSRDFWLLSGVIILLSLLVGLWMSYQTYQDYTDKVAKQLETEAARIDRSFIIEMESASYLIESMARQISNLGTTDLVPIAQLFNAFQARSASPNLFSWIDANQLNAIDSNRGILEHPPSLSDRDYVKKSLTEPWQIQIGRPVLGRTSGRWIIPLAMGMTDNTGKFMGTLLLGINLHALTEKTRQSIETPEVRFAITTQTFLPVSQPSAQELPLDDSVLKEKLVGIDLHRQPKGMLSRANPFRSDSLYSFYEVSSNYPYIIFVGVNRDYGLNSVFQLMLPRLIQIAVVAVFLMAMLWMLRHRVIRPVVDLTTIASGIARGEGYIAFNRQGPIEIEALATQLRKIADYIDERKRLEGELLAKTSILQRTKETAELTNRIKVEFLASVSHELRTPLNNIVGFSEIMRNQLYGPIENPTYRQYIDDIHRSGQQLLDVINDVLMLAKAESEPVELKEKPLRIEHVVSKALRGLQDKLAHHQVNIKTVVPDHLPRLMMDEGRLKQIITNLVSHVLRLTPAGGEILIEAKRETDRRQQHSLLLMFSGSGPYSAARLSQEAAQIQHGERGRPKEMVEFSGLALPLSKTLVALHQSTLEVENILGRGTVITLRFPKERLAMWE